MGSFRESSEVEYGADDAYLMVHEGEVNKVTGCRNVVMRHLKSRDHCQRDFRLEFDGAIQKFRLLPDRDNGNQTQHGDAVVVSPADVRRGEGQSAGQSPRASAGLMSSGFGWLDEEYPQGNGRPAAESRHDGHDHEDEQAGPHDYLRRDPAD